MRNRQTNRHGFLAVEADRLLQTISENLNYEIGKAESQHPDVMMGHSRRQMQAVMASLVNLQYDYTYEEVLQTLEKMISMFSIKLAHGKYSLVAKESMLKSVEVLTCLQRLFMFLKCNTFQI